MLVSKFPVPRASFFVWLQYYAPQQQHKDLIPNTDLGPQVCIDIPKSN